MKMRFLTMLCVLFFYVKPNTGREHNKNYNPILNTDFLLHESGGIPNTPKRDNLPTNTNIETNGKNNYNSQFPQLGSTHKSQHTNTNQQSLQSNGKRDYVSPQFTTPRPSPGQTLIPPSTRNPNHNPSSSTRGITPLSPTTKLQPNHQTTGKVKDLIHFYDGKSKDQNAPQPIPSYSSILQGTGNNNFPTSGSIGSTKITQPYTQTTPKPPTTKPFSYSAMVSGSNKPSTLSVYTTPKPSTRGPVLPSVILNNNRNTNTGSDSRSTSDTELQTLSEELLRKDTNNAAKYITMDFQEKTTSQSKEDKAPLPLLNISSAAWNIPTIEKIVPLLDNYERSTLVNEHVTPQERNEENAFMDAIMATSVMRHLMNFLKEKGYVTPDPRQQRDFVKQLWFSLYSRGKGKISSSGFEHIFVSELKNGEVSGLHNWIYFSKEEEANRLNYLGYLKYRQFGERGAVIKFHFTQQGVDKPVNSMFIGTSPELEMALYTLCFVTRADSECNLKLANNDVSIMTHTFRYRSKNLIGSGYPQI